MEEPPPGGGSTDRYLLRGLIGRGAMGLVYRAHDVELGRDVALKTLERSTPEDLYHLKHEFRALAGLTHPNLVELYDLVVSATRCFFTMELIDGTDFVTYLRGAESGNAAGPLGPPGVQRLRAVLPQLVAGLGALHAAGKLHRDVKPSNVLVTREGRAVLVDFDLVAERPRGTGSPACDHEVAGSFDYMAPEQVWGMQPTPAADWYSLGVLLYQTLTGRLPFDGPLSRTPPAPPASGEADLDALALALLRARPEERPGGAEVSRLIGFAGDDAHRFPSTATVWEAPFVDREVELAGLRDAYEASRRGEPAVVHVLGPSGIGKTAMLQHLLDEVMAHDPPPLVLSGRCRPQESVPFEALDSLVDSLSRFLVSAPRGNGGAPRALQRPRHATALIRLFPVLGRVEALASGTEEDGTAGPQEVRRQAFAALRELLETLARTRPLVIWLDDLHWGDLDSAAFLRDLAQSPVAGLLLLLSYRSEDRTTSPLLRELGAGSDAPAGTRTLTIGPLPPDQARRLARHLIPYPEAEERLDAIAAESGGSPFLACELARYVASQGAVSPGQPVQGLADVVGERVQRLPPAARRLLEVVAVNGGPLPGAVAGAVADLGRAWRPAVDALRSQCLLRHGLLADDDALEIYHDRIRESVVTALPFAARRDHHLRLLEALDARPDPDPLALLRHSLGAGRVERGARLATLAAEQAARALAFNRAARLYGLALELGPDDAARGQLLERRAEAFANAGLAAEAGDCYESAATHRAAARGPDDADVLQLRRCAAEQHLRSGRFDDGLRELRTVLRSAGVRYPESARTAVARTLVHRAVIFTRGLRYEIRRKADVSPADLTRLDACWSAAVGLVWVDPIRSSDFQGRHTRLALQVGEPTRVVRALATEAAFLAAVGGARGHRRAARALADARTLAAEQGDPPSIGLTEVCAAIAAYFAGRFDDAVPLARAAEEILRTRCVGVAWELTNCHIATLWSLAYGGQIAALDELVPGLLREARDRGDLLATASLAAFLPDNLRHLAADRIDEARARATEAVAGWPTGAFLLPHYYELYSQTQIDLYAGEPRSAWERLEAAWKPLESSMLLHFQVVRTDAGALKARVALAAALAEDGSRIGQRRRRRLLGIAAREARCLDGEDMPWCAPWATTIRAGIALASGSRGTAEFLLARAIPGFERAGMGLMAAAARFHGGRLAGGDAGRRLRDDATRWMDAQGIHDPGAMARLLLPDVG